MEDRIIELETKLSYQDQLLEELNQLVSEQQQQITKLTHQYEKFLEKTEGENQGEVLDVPPPHY